MSLGALGLARASHAGAEDALGFVQQQHQRIEQLLREQASNSRDAQVRHALGSFVDYQHLTRRAFDEPCPASEPACEDIWASYNDDQRAEVRHLLEPLPRKRDERYL